MRELRAHQKFALEKLKEAIRSGKRRPLVAMPTGAGKTLLAAHIVAGALSKGKRVIFCVPAIALVDQTVEAFGREGIHTVGVIQADHWMTDYSEPVQVASVQTLARRGWPDADVVIVDEAHLAFRTVFKRMQERPDKLFIGLSATPFTRGLGRYYDELIVGSTTQSLIDTKLLSSFQVYAPTHPDLTGVRTVAGDYHEGDLSKVMDKTQLTADIVSTWLRIGENRPTLCFAVDRAHAKNLQSELERSGVSAAYVDAYTEPSEREQIRRAFHDGQIQVVCNVGVLTTGIDWDVRCLILARPTKSKMLYQQIVGRGLRVAPGKTDCLILDHSDTTLRLGFATDIHVSELDNGTLAKSTARTLQKAPPLPRECPACSALRPACVHKCLACGFQPERQVNVLVADGELVQVKGAKPSATSDDKQRWYSMLLWQAQERGYRRGWAAKQYQEKFGVWPRGLRETSIPPDQQVQNFLIAQRIRFAKRREKAKKAATVPPAARHSGGTPASKGGGG